MPSSRRRSLFCCCGPAKSAFDDSGAYAALENSEGNQLSGSYQPPSVAAGKPRRGFGVQATSATSLASRVSASRPVPALKDFKLLKCIGKGGFSKVMQVEHKGTHAVYALKAVSKTMLKGAKEEERLLAEAQILRRIAHPFCITLQYSFQTPRELLYIFEFVPGGVLYHHLRQKQFFNEARARFYIGELILALEYLHGLSIIYRDLKLENCLIAHDGHLRLTDFGAAKDLMGDAKTTTFCGTPCYIAPEILRGEQYDQSVDWWTTGVILYEMLIGKPPFSGNNRHSLYKNVLKSPIALPERLSPAAKDILMQLLQRNPLSRLGGHMLSRGDSASVLKAHDFFYTPRTRSASTLSSSPPVGSPSSAAGGACADKPPPRSTSAATQSSSGAGGEPTIAEEEDEDDSLEESNLFEGVQRPAPVGSTAAAAASQLEGQEARRGSRKRLASKEPNTWTWQELSQKKVEAPWKPQLVSQKDTTYFDPIITSEPVSFLDLPGARGAPVRKDLVKIEDFDWARG